MPHPFDEAAQAAIDLADAKARFARLSKKSGPGLIDSLCAFDSLRSLAESVSLSPTYLSRVRKGHIEISPEAYLRLAAIAGRAPKPKGGK